MMKTIVNSIKEFEKLKNKNITRIDFDDYSDYEVDNCETGGRYSFHHRYHRSTRETFQAEYSTSSVFEYCSVCGSFHEPCKDELYEVTKKTLYRMIELVLKNQEPYHEVGKYVVTIYHNQ